MQGAKYPSLMRKLRSHVLQGVAKRNKLKKKKKEQVRNSVDKWDPSVFQLLLLQNSAVLMADN